MVARVTPSGGLDGSFGSGGKVVGGLVDPGYGFKPTDVAIDSAGKPVVTGSKVWGTPPVYRWGVMRLTPNGAPLLDKGFGTDGRWVPATCQNQANAGPSGLTVSGNSILVVGGCESTARTTVARLKTESGPPSGPIERHDLGRASGN
jgi:hypothetical protein